MAGFLREIPENVRNVLRVARLRPFDTASDEGRSRERYRRIVLGTAASLLARLISAVGGLVIVPIMLHHAGKDGYGLWVAAGSLAAWVSLLDPGLSAGLLNGVAEAEGRDDRLQARSLFSTALYTLGLVAILALLAFGALASSIDWRALIHFPDNVARSDVTWTFAACFGLAILTLPFGTVTQVYMGSQRAYLAMTFATLGSLASLGALIASASLDASLPVLSSAVAIGGLVAGLIGFVHLVNREMPWMRPRFADIAPVRYRRLFASAAPLYAFQVGSLLVNQSQSLVLARRAGLGSVAAYDLLWRFVILGVGLVTLGTGAAFPTFREAWERGDRTWMRRAFWHVVRLRLGLALGGCVVLLLFGNTILRLWLGTSDFQYSLADWMLAAAIIGAAVWTSAFLELLSVLDRIWVQIPLVLLQGLLTTYLTWLLVSSLGIRGALIGSLVPSVGLACWVFPWLAWDLVATKRRN
ncbi:MAG: lipopolysaccharide biosynthesis protein [Anaeromyxobacteraceae bacterium]